MAELENTNGSTQRSVAGYDRLAPVYRSIEWLALGNALMRARKSLAGDMAAAQEILVLGDGDGRLLAELARCQPAAKFTSIDQSPKMLEIQRRRLHRMAAANRVKFVCADATLPEHFQHQFDAVVAAFFLDCFDNDSLDRLLKSILDSISARGEFYVVDFVEPTAKLPRIYAKFMLRLMHSFFAWQTGLQNRKLIDVPKKLSDLGWEIKQQQDHHFKMMTARIYRRRLTNIK